MGIYSINPPPPGAIFTLFHQNIPYPKFRDIPNIPRKGYRDIGIPDFRGIARYPISLSPIYPVYPVPISRYPLGAGRRYSDCAASPCPRRLGENVGEAWLRGLA